MVVSSSRTYFLCSHFFFVLLNAGVSAAIMMFRPIEAKGYLLAIGISVVLGVVMGKKWEKAGFKFPSPAGMTNFVTKFLHISM